MARSDYDHLNEDGDYVWWMEEGRHGSEEPDYDPDRPMTGAEMDQEEAYDQGYYDAENGEDKHGSWFTDPRFRASYLAGYEDGSFEPEGDDDDND